MDKPTRLDKLTVERWKYKGDKKAEEAAAEAVEAVNDILVSPVLKGVLCNATNFSFNPCSTILAKIDRAELGDHDALVLGLFIIAEYQQQARRQGL